MQLSGRSLPAGTPFIAMELIEGEPLNKVLSKSDRLPVDEFLNLAVQIAEGLSEAHARGIVHRDLKPMNVLVTSKGLAKILDFGLAKPTASGGSVSLETATAPLTEEGASVLGTTPYMSPEQATGRAVDSRSDIFSFGVMLYEMLTGKRPFQRTDPRQKRWPRSWRRSPQHSPRSGEDCPRTWSESSVAVCARRQRNGTTTLAIWSRRWLISRGKRAARG